MNLSQRIEGVVDLAEYMLSNTTEWEETKRRASEKNTWFTDAFISLAITNLVHYLLDENKLNDWVHYYHLDDNVQSRNIGIVMPGNIPLAGFHDFLCVFISGHRQTIKLSSKDDILLKHLIEKLYEIEPDTRAYIFITDILKNCDGYIATGSNNTSRYFNYYFGRYPSIIRKNRTSAAVIKGNEDLSALELLADDVHLYFGLGCRNVTKIFVPEGYDFVPLLDAFRKYNYFSDHPKYKNNYDYYLAILLMNNKFYMTNESILLLESEELFSPISQVNYSFYNSHDWINEQLKGNENIQAIEGLNGEGFGKLQQPGLFDYADGVDTMQFLLSL